MKIRHNLQKLKSGGPSVVTIGKFDGIHRGHRELIRETVSSAREMKAVPAVFSFDMASVMLLSKDERRAMLGEAGVGLLVECDFGPEIITMEAEDFVEKILLEKLQMKKVIVGEHFRFGYGRRGDAELLLRMGEECGFGVRLVPEVMDGDVKISSSVIREAVGRGDMERANGLLGYSFFVTGRIIHGRQLGRTLGVPTANLITDRSKLLPPNGVYYTRGVVGDRSWNGITNIGTKPTVDGHFIGVETYFFDCDENLYGEDLRVELLHFSRPEQKFSDLAALKERISLDETEGRAYFAARRCAGV